MQIIDDIMMSIHEYCNDPNAVENINDDQLKAMHERYVR